MLPSPPKKVYDNTIETKNHKIQSKFIDGQASPAVMIIRASICTW